MQMDAQCMTDMVQKGKVKSARALMGGGQARRHGEE